MTYGISKNSVVLRIAETRHLDHLEIWAFASWRLTGRLQLDCKRLNFRADESFGLGVTGNSSSRFMKEPCPVYQSPLVLSLRELERLSTFFYLGGLLWPRAT